MIYEDFGDLNFFAARNGSVCGLELRIVLFTGFVPTAATTFHLQSEAHGSCPPAVSTANDFPVSHLNPHHLELLPIRPI